jgi:hypothetical protein
MPKLLTGKDLKVGKRYAIVSKYTSDEVGGCELNMNTFVVEGIDEDGDLHGSDVHFYGSHGTWCLFGIDDTELTFIEVVGEEHTNNKQEENDVKEKHLVAVYQNEFKATNMTYAGKSVEEIVDSMEVAGDDFRDFVIYDLTGLESKKIKLGLE